VVWRPILDSALIHSEMMVQTLSALTALLSSIVHIKTLSLARPISLLARGYFCPTEPYASGKPSRED
jgi:hypothetical protein